MWKILLLVSWTRRKGTNCASLWKLLSLSFHLLLLLFGQGSCGSMLCLTWRWKKRRGKAQPSNNSSILFHGHIHNLAEKSSWNTKEQNGPNSHSHLSSTLTLHDTCQQPKTFSKYVSQPPQLLKAFVATSAPDGICMQNSAKHASLEPLQKPPPSSSDNLELQLTNFISRE